MKRSALIIAVLNSFITPFMGSSVNIALPAIQKEFHVDAVLLSWIATSYLLAVAVTLVPFGRLADIYGRKKIFTYGIVLFTLASVLCSLSVSTAMLLVFRTLQGAGNAMVFATGMAILVSVYPPEERGKALGINVAAVYIGLSVGPFVGGLLTRYFSWRSIFLVTVPLGIFIIFLIFSRLKGEWADSRGEKYDLPGSVIYAVTIMALIFGMTSLPAIRGICIFLAGLVCLAAFIQWELKVKSPILEIRLFRTNRVFAFSNLAALISYSATFALVFLLSLYLQYIKQLSPQTAGLMLMTQPFFMAFLSPFAGRLSDRIEPRIVATFGMILTFIGLVLMSFLGEKTSLIYLTAILIVLGSGFGFFSSPNTNAIIGSVDKRYFGIASGMVGTMRSFGMIVSMGIATVVFSIYIGRIQITQEQYPLLIKSIRVAFAIFSLLSFGGIFASMVRGKLRGNNLHA
ncbi:putative transport protein [uncultured Desulfobacterium sp.]|uniref:Putative transport protein n=1 Tax=uncultured Desulfobacterium sp. TaxID=201089 RepID=A0A445MTG5_9BACT|nr:putative transport protein [uncultured Desulfobacterium sp.]